MGAAPARMGVPGDFPGIFIQGYGFDFDGVGSFVVQQGDGVFAGRFDQFGNVKRMFLPGQGGRRPCADPGRIEKPNRFIRSLYAFKRFLKSGKSFLPAGVQPTSAKAQARGNAW